MSGQGGVLYSTVSSARSPASKPCRTKCSRWPFETGTRFMDGPPAVDPQGEPATFDPGLVPAVDALTPLRRDRKSTRLNSSHVAISYAVLCLTKERRQDH